MRSWIFLLNTQTFFFEVKTDNRMINGCESLSQNRLSSLNVTICRAGDTFHLRKFNFPLSLNWKHLNVLATECLSVAVFFESSFRLLPFTTVAQSNKQQESVYFHLLICTEITSMRIDWKKSFDTVFGLNLIAPSVYHLLHLAKKLIYLIQSQKVLK